ncbi:MAG: carbohydrate binding domain-containing protein [Victivallaceae bacterium]
MKTESGKKTICLITTLSLMMGSMFMLSPSVEGGTINLPNKYPRTNPNLLSNPAFNGSANWTLNSGPVYQSTGGHTADGSGCIKFPAGEDTYCQLVSDYINYPNFEYNTPYTISFYMKTQHEPVYLHACLHMYDVNNNRTFSYNTGRLAVSTTGEWQEAVCIVNITDPNIVKVKVVIEEVSSAAYTSDFFVDDVYFGKAISFAEAPVTSRQTFSGSKVTIDELGNWRVYESGVWKDFLPFGLQPDDSRTQQDYNSLSNQGFNSMFGMQYKSQIQTAANATSSYNPTGLRSALRLSTYATPGQTYWTLTRLASTITDINSSLSENLLGYYWDNEENWTTWSPLWFDMVSTIRNNDSNHPIYVNNGDPAVQRLFSKRLSDVCGTYYGMDGTAMESGPYKFDVLQYLQKQDIPASVNQINNVENTSYGMRMRIYYGLINGAKGFIWWGDCVARAETCAWWSDIQYLRSEIDQMLPVLKQPHWTNWSATCSDSSILFNTRDYQSNGYMIVMNPGSSSIQATFTLSGYAATEVWNYFNSSLVTAVASNQFTVTLPAHSTAVYRLIPEIMVNGGMETAGSPLTGWSAYGAGTVSRDTATKYAGAASCKIVNTAITQNSGLLQYLPALKPGTNYSFSAMVKYDSVVRDTSSDYNGVIVQLNAGTNMFFPLPAESGTRDWHPVQHSFTTPSNGTTWYVRLRLWNASGTVWFDNVTLQEVP